MGLIAKRKDIEEEYKDILEKFDIDFSEDKKEEEKN